MFTVTLFADSSTISMPSTTSVVASCDNSSCFPKSIPTSSSNSPTVSDDVFTFCTSPSAAITTSAFASSRKTHTENKATTTAVKIVYPTFVLSARNGFNKFCIFFSSLITILIIETIQNVVKINLVTKRLQFHYMEILFSDYFECKRIYGIFLFLRYFSVITLQQFRNICSFL